MESSTLLFVPLCSPLLQERSGGELKCLVAIGQFEGDPALVDVHQSSTHRIGDRSMGHLEHAGFCSSDLTVSYPVVIIRLQAKLKQPMSAGSQPTCK